MGCRQASRAGFTWENKVELQPAPRADVLPPSVEGEEGGVDGDSGPGSRTPMTWKGYLTSRTQGLPHKIKLPTLSTFQVHELRTYKMEFLRCKVIHQSCQISDDHSIIKENDERELIIDIWPFRSTYTFISLPGPVVLF